MFDLGYRISSMGVVGSNRKPRKVNTNRKFDQICRLGKTPLSLRKKIVTKYIRSKHKTRKFNRKESVDRISNLPDDILSHILSFLPTKFAVGTSILSKRWRYIWTSLTRFDFDSNLMLDERNFDKQHLPTTSFAPFVDRVLKLASNIEQVFLHSYEEVDRSRVANWMSELTKHDVSELHIDIKNLELPLSFFSFNKLTLLVFRVNSHSVINIPQSFSLPSLKYLDVDMENPPNELTEKLFSSCPALEELYIRGYISRDAKQYTFNVSAPALETLKISLFVERMDEYGHTIVLDCPNLTHFYVDEKFLAKYIVKNLSSLIKATLEIGNCFLDPANHEYSNRAYELLRKIDTVQYLSLHSGSVSSLEYNVGASSLPKFRNLIVLELVMHDLCGWEMLPSLFESAPNLVCLSIKKEYLHGTLGFPGAEMLEEFLWIPPDSPPTCFLNHLEFIQTIGFEGSRYQLELLQYILSNAMVLKTLIIETSPELARDSQVVFCSQVMTYPKISSICEVIFDESSF